MTTKAEGTDRIVKLAAMAAAEAARTNAPEGHGLLWEILAQIGDLMPSIIADYEGYCLAYEVVRNRPARSAAQ